MSDEEEYDTENENLEESGSDSGSEESSETDSDSDSSVDLSAARNWIEVNPSNPPAAHPRFPFTAIPSINVGPFDRDIDILEYFENYVSDELCQLICQETNRYASQYIAAHPRAKPFAELIVNELRVFLALVVLAGVVKKPDMDQYWSKNPLIVTPFFAQSMSHRRFKQIKQYLHFTNNTTYDRHTHPNPKLNKIWPVLEKVKASFKGSITPERDITIDESLLLFKGRLSWKQYIPLKRARFGIKSYMLCESKSGYVYDLIIYTGKGSASANVSQQVGMTADEFKKLPKSTQVVLILCKDLLGQGYFLTTDNFYTSPQLADILIQKKTDTCGTVKLNRKQIPKAMQKKELKKKKLKHGDIVSYQRGKVLLLAWKDKKIVSLLSTVHSAKMVNVTKRGVTKKRPECVVAYNDTMGGVDRVDQHVSTYASTRKRGKKYYKKIFFHLLDLCLWNAFVLYKKCDGKLTSLQFRLEIVKRTMETHLTDDMKTKQGRPSTSLNPARLTERHFPEYIPPTAAKQNPTRQCAMCSRVKDSRGKKIRRESRYYCPDCNVPLCVTPCFRVYHTVTDI